MNDPRQILRQKYGFDFPDSFFEFKRFVDLAKTKGLSLYDALDMSLGDVFEVFNPELDLENFDPVEKSRYYCDPPEFFTVLYGHTDGLHWGYWVDGHSADEYPVVSYYHSDAYELGSDGDGLFEALRYRMEQAHSGYLDNAHYAPHDEEEQAHCTQQLTRIEALRQALSGFPTSERKETGEAYIDRYGGVPRDVLAPTYEGMGLVAPEHLFRPLAFDPFSTAHGYRPNDDSAQRLYEEGLRALEEGFPATALKIGRDLWIFSDYAELSANLLDAAYDAMGLGAQRQIVRRFRMGRSAADLPEYQKALDNPQEHGTGLHFGGKNVVSIPDSIATLQHLTHLTAYNNRLTTLPQAIGELPALKWVNLSDNRLEGFPTALFGLESLEHLDLTRNSGVDTIPNDPRGLPGLKHIKINGLQWTRFPEAVAAWPALETLEFASSVAIDTLPAALGQMTSLRKLVLQTRTPLQHVDPAIAQATALEIIVYGSIMDGYAHRVEIPDAFFEARSVKSLTLECNQRLVIPDALARMTELETLRLSVYQLEEVPLSVWRLSKLKKLSLSGRLGKISGRIAALEALEELECGACQLTTLPEALDALPNLKRIRASYNEFSPAEADRLKARLSHIELIL